MGHAHLENGYAPTPPRRLARYDMAKDTLGNLLANCSARIAEEEKRTVPDQAQIEQIMEQRRQLMALGRSLDHDDVAKREEVIATYGPQVRKAWCRSPIQKRPLPHEGLDLRCPAFELAATVGAN